MGKVKDKIDALDQPGGVHNISCHTCTEAYIGETGRTAKVRGKEHNACFRNGHLQLSAVAEHASMGHQVFWEPRVSDRERRYWKRRIKEGLIIEQQRSRGGVMNVDKGLELSKLWLGLFQV